MVHKGTIERGKRKLHQFKEAMEAYLHNEDVRVRKKAREAEHTARAKRAVALDGILSSTGNSNSTHNFFTTGHVKLKKGGATRNTPLFMDRVTADVKKDAGLLCSYCSHLYHLLNRNKRSALSLDRFDSI